VRRVEAQLHDLVDAPRVLLQVLGVLALNRVQLALRRCRREQRLHEKAREAVQRRFQRVLRAPRAVSPRAAAPPLPPGLASERTWLSVSFRATTTILATTASEDASGDARAWLIEK